MSAFETSKENIQDRIAAGSQWISRLDDRQTCALLTISIALIAAGDLLLFPFGLMSGPFYMLPICLACWKLSFRSTLSVIFVTAALSILTFAVHGRPMTLIGSLANLCILTLVPGFVALIVASLRSSADRQHMLAHHDSRTGVLNSMGFANRATAVLSVSARSNRTMLLCFIDLDGFKQVNDRFGHEAGDLTLTRFGAAVRASLRSEDCFGRIGGDEFAWLVSLEQPATARAVAETLHRRLVDTLSTLQQGLGCSLGALILPPTHPMPLGELMRYADQLMYRAKRSGRNQLRIASVVEIVETEVTDVPSHRHLGDNCEVAALSKR